MPPLWPGYAVNRKAMIARLVTGTDQMHMHRLSGRHMPDWRSWSSNAKNIAWGTWTKCGSWRSAIVERFLPLVLYLGIVLLRRKIQYLVAIALNAVAV
jgi:hypothetical protein